MSAPQALSDGRRAAEALMDAACTVSRIIRVDVNGDGVVDDNDLDANLEYVDETVAIYTGVCRLKFATNRVLSKDAEGQILAAQELLLYLPTSGASGAVQVDDVVTITDGGADPATLNRRFRITGLFSQTFATARRFPVESLS